MKLYLFRVAFTNEGSAQGFSVVAGSADEAIACAKELLLTALACELVAVPPYKLTHLQRGEEIDGICTVDVEIPPIREGIKR
jgi:hypothetical protein